MLSLFIFYSTSLSRICNYTIYNVANQYKLRILLSIFYFIYLNENNYKYNFYTTNRFKRHNLKLKFKLL